MLQLHRTRTVDPVASQRGTPPAPEPEPLRFRIEDQAGHLLRRASQRATAVFVETAGEGGLTPTQFAALAKLHAEGELSQNHLGRLTAMDPATIQGVVRRLIDRGLIRSRADASDRRRTLLSLTPLGDATAERAIPRAARAGDRVLDRLSAEERGLLIRLLRRIG